MEAPARRGAVSGKLAASLVSLRKRYSGKGPPRSAVHIFDGLVLCISEDWMTPAERSLRDAGKPEEVRRMRRWLDEALSAEAVEIVESLTERRVISFLSEYNVEHDRIVDLFVLEPNGRPAADGPRLG